VTPSALGSYIYDNSGSPVWIRDLAGKAYTNFGVGSYRGSPVLSWWEGMPVAAGYGQGEYVIVDRSYSEIGRVKAANGLQGDLHEFLITAQGTALLTIYSPLAGSANLLDGIVQEIDIASGRLLFEWRASDHVDPAESYLPPPFGKPLDFFHINSVDADTDGNLLVSSRHTWTVYKIDRVTGRVIWRLGGKKSDFAMGQGARFAWQHDARRQPDGSITLFDNGSDGSTPSTEDLSRGLVLDVSESAHTASLRNAYTHPAILAMSQGSMQLLPDGNVVVGWGFQPRFTEFAADGTIILDGRLPDGSFSYRTLHFDWHGIPAQPPAVTSEQEPNGTAIYVSWNGDTEVANWVALGGDSPTALSPLGSKARTGFETTIPVHGRPKYIAARALDAAGATLTQSPAVAGW